MPASGQLAGGRERPGEALGPEEPQAHSGGERDGPGEEGERLHVGGDVARQDGQREPGQRGGAQRQERGPAPRVDLPGGEREQERDLVVGGVPGIEQAAQEQRQREQQQAVGARVGGRPGEAPPGRGERGDRHDEERMGDRTDPAGRGAVAVVRGEGAHHQVAVRAEEPPRLPGLEDRAGGVRGARQAGARPAVAEARDEQRCDEHRRGARGDADGEPMARGQQREDRDDRDDGPRLGAAGEAEQRAGERRALAPGGQRGEGDERADEQFLGVADLERSDRQRVRGAQDQREPRADLRHAAVTGAGPQQDAEHGPRSEAGDGHHAKEGEGAAVPDVRDQGEGRAQDQRTPVCGRLREEVPDVAVAQRVERRLRLDLVVGEGHRQERLRGEPEGAQGGAERGQQET